MYTVLPCISIHCEEWFGIVGQSWAVYSQGTVVNNIILIGVYLIRQLCGSGWLRSVVHLFTL